MVVGIFLFELHLPDSRSLKDKRQIIRRILRRTQGHFNVSVAEVEHHDLWQRASIGVSCVSKTTYQSQKLFYQITKELAAISNISLLKERSSYVNLKDIEE